MPRRILLALLAVTGALGAPAIAAAEPYTHRVQATATGSDGAVATVDKTATDAAIQVLKRGGNAVDAAVAAAGVLTVSEPFSCGIGGGGFMVVRTPTGDVATIDSREKAPLAMRPNSFYENGAPLAFGPARYSGLSAGVPGTVRGWETALRRYGSRSLRSLMRPAEDVAREGFVADLTLVNQTTANLPWFDDLPATAELYLDDDGSQLDVGDVIKNPDLGRLLRRIGADGGDAFYTGAVAEAIARAVQAPPTGPGADKTWRSGLMTVEDLARYRAKVRPATHVRYRGLDVYSMGPPSSGGSTVGEALNILEQVEGYDRLSDVDKLHDLLEASRVAFADRNAYLADPSFFQVPLRSLLSDSYAAERRQVITPQAANRSVPAGDPSDNAGAAEATSRPDQSTTHLTVADKDGMVVSYTFTIESIGGNAIVVPGYGFLLNNELTDFNYDNPLHPNRPEGGKRPRSSMAPTIVERDGDPFLATGSPGGASIITTVLQNIVEQVDFGLSLPDAIALPRASQRNGATSEPEQGFLDRFGADLTAQHGHAFGRPAAELGTVAAVRFQRNGRIVAATEGVRRGGGNAQVVLPRR